MTDRFHLVWREGLCRHGCGDPVAHPRNRFINGHDSKLLDILLDAHRADALIRVTRNPGTIQVPVDEFDATAYAREAFWPRGFRWYLVKAGIEDPAYDELQGAEDPDLSSLDMGSATDPGGRLGGVQAAYRTGATHALSEGAEERERLLAHIQQLEIGLAAAVGLRLDDEQVLRLLQARFRACARVLQQAGYEGDVNEVWDMVTMFRQDQADPVVIEAGRAVLGLSQPG